MLKELLHSMKFTPLDSIVSSQFSYARDSVAMIPYISTVINTKIFANDLNSVMQGNLFLISTCASCSESIWLWITS